jgi:amino acid adenylation domain-containing protein
MSNTSNNTSKPARDLSPEEKRALLAELLKAGVNRPRSFPLSFAQERLWFLDQLQPGSSAYNVPLANRLAGQIDIRALELSLNEIIRRHEALRTRFQVKDGKPIQVISPSLSIEVRVEDLTQLSAGERENEASKIAQQEAQEPFDLSSGPLVRARLLKLSATEHVLLLTLHHIISDGWSLGVLFKELAVLYEAYLMGKPSPLEELPIQYADYAQWQREYLRGDVLEKQVEYWRRQLETAAVLGLPTDKARPLIQSYRGQLQGFEVSKEVSAALRQLSQQEGTTMFMTLLAVFKVLLYRYSGQEDIVVGTPIAGRNRAELEGLIGFFVNTLVLRTEVEGGASFRELLRRVREVTLGAYGHQDLPFEKLVEEIHPQRDMSRNPLFQVMFMLMNAGVRGQSAAMGEAEGGGDKGGVAVDIGAAKFDLTMSMVETGESLAGTIEYAVDLYEAESITRMIGHYKELMRSVVEEPDEAVGRLRMLSKQEEEQIRRWNETKSGYERGRSIHEQFEEQVKRRGNAVAVEYEEEKVSYEQLNGRANQLARYLRGLGVGPEVRVGICLERSVEAVVALLGVLKAGGVHTPLDPSYPKERLEFMIKDSQAPVLLTQQNLADVVGAVQGLRIVKLDSEWDEIAREGEENFASGVTPDNAAYVIYTSGSTGKPKGVCMPHRCLMNLHEWQRQHSMLPDRAKTLQFTSFSFDVSFLEMLSTLGSGGTVVMIPEYLRQDMMAMARLLTKSAIDRVFLPYTALNQLAEVFPKYEEVTPTTKEIVSTGEQLRVTPAIAALFVKIGGRLVNEYGPTETHFVSAYKMPNGANEWPVYPPIGHPIANTQVYLLDNNLQQVPIGVIGELYAAGECLARGYINRPELTAEKFIPNPFGEEPGARLYRTGDLARYLPDGNIEYLGRIDHQIKIRGYRIELGEIEAVLSQHHKVREVAVAVLEGVQSDKRLIGYVVPEQNENPTSAELRSYLKDILPEYMVPVVILTIDKLPVSPNGKLDRKALPAPEMVRSDENYLAPRSSVEETLANIWSEVLGIEKVGVNDSFFELGGHSLLATLVVSRIRDTFEVDLPLRRIFEAPTIGEVSVAIVQRQIEQADAQEVLEMVAELEGM